MSDCTIREDIASFDLEMICDFIQNSYWGQGRSRRRILECFEHSFCFGAFVGDRQAGFARVVSDRVFHAYVFDVFVLPEFRGQGIAKKLMRAILEHEHLREVTGFMLTTRDAHKLYEPFGFKSATEAAKYMTRNVPEPA